MRNLRIIYDNAADRAVVSATPQVSTLGSENLLSDDKFRVCRSTGKTMTITATWPSSEPISGIALPFTNLSPTATIRARMYAANGTTVTFDSGVVLACPAPARRLRGWTAAASASAYGYGGGSSARMWFAKQQTTKLVIDISDTNNLQGYVESSRLIVGDYWEPKGVGAEAGASVSIQETSKHFRTDAGNTITDIGIRFKKQSVSMPSLEGNDRHFLWDILNGNGMATPIFISLYPESTDAAWEARHELYGKLSVTPVMTTPYFNVNSATIELEEV